MIKIQTLTFTIITQPGQPVAANQFDDSVMKFRNENGICAENIRGIDYFCSSVFMPKAEIPVLSTPNSSMPILRQMGAIIQTTFCCNIEWETEDETPPKEDVKLKIDKE